MIAQLSYGEDYLHISNMYYYKNDEKRSVSFNNTTFDISVRSGSFSGAAGWECDIHSFIAFVETLEKMYNFQEDHAVLEDTCYGSRIGISMDKTGHLTVSGQIYGKGLQHSLAFAFSADQSCLDSFVRQLWVATEGVGGCL